MLGTWRSKVEKDLGGVAFERALVTELAGALRVQPLYDGSSAAPQPLSRGAGLTLASIVHAHDAPEGQPDAVLGARWVLGAREAADDSTIHERAGASAHVVEEGGRAVVHALDVDDAGGSVPLSLAVAIGRWLDALRASPASPPSIAVAVGNEIFVEVAKLRALRVLAERSALALGAHPSVRILARTSFVGLARIEPETNALRATLATVAATLGGADLVAVAPYDVLAPTTGDVHARAARLAITTGLIASLESHLASTDDPLHGAYLVESLTHEMTEAAWSIVRELEQRGGVQASAATWKARLADEGRERQRAARGGKLPRVGASRLARVDAPSLGPVHASLVHVLRDTAAFESLRDEAIARGTTLVVVGDPRKTAARAEYLREVLSTWGAPTTSAALATTDTSSDAVPGDAFVLCAEDADFAALAALARALAARGSVMVAGRPGAHEAALRDAGVAAFLHLGADLPAVARAFFARPTSGARGGEP
jgi:methylmalonyl-CoA mutase